MSEKFDFVIAGAGVYGCSVAWELAKRGAEVLLLEAHEVACGASGGAGKRGVRANGRDHRELPFMRQSYQRWLNLHEEIGGPTGYERTGQLTLIERESEMVAAESQVWLQNLNGISTRLVTREALTEMEPDLGEQVLAAIYCPHDGVADHTLATQSFAQAARRLGVEIREGTSLEGVERKGDKISAILTNKDVRIDVNKSLLLLSNSHIPSFIKEHFGITLPVWWVLPQVLFVDPSDPVRVRHLIGHTLRVLAIKSGPAGQVMISGGWRGRWNTDREVGETLPDQVAGNFKEAVSVYPGLEGGTVAAAYADRKEGIAVDRIPIIDNVPGINNLFLATGWSGHGWAIAPAISRLLAEWVFNGDRPALFHPFSLSRFKA